ncbi:MAG: diacylglycerol kinase [Myxococcales bacterium]|nr:diacylglycerol kinase [Myxococcales bacterium]
MGYRVIQWSTGNVGHYALRSILGHPELELAGLWVHSEKKSGRDAGELIGLPAAGVVATHDADALLESDADCVCYTATADLRIMDAIEDVCRILRAGKNVVSSSVVSLVHPDGMGPEIRRKIEDACREGDSSFLTNGIDPGFANDVLPLVLSGLCEKWEEIRVQEIVNYATYDQPEVVMGTMGFGQPLDATPLLLTPGILEMAWGGSVRLMAQGLGVELDSVEAWHERLPADESFDVPIGHVAKGTMAGLRFEVRGMVGGKARIVVEHVTRLRDDIAPDWPQSDGGYNVIISGVPRIEVRLDMADEHGDHAVGGVVLTATRLVNAIPAVCDAGPGFMTALDLPTITGKGLMAR